MFRAKRAICENDIGHQDYFYFNFGEITIHYPFGFRKKINFSKIPCKQEFKLFKWFYKVKNILTIGFSLKCIILSSTLSPSPLSLPLPTLANVDR